MIKRTAGGGIGVRTNVIVRVWDLDWNLISVHRSHNTWTEAGLDVLRDWTYGDFTEDHITHIAWCDASGNEWARDLITQRIRTTTNQYKIRQYLGSATSANGYVLGIVKAYNAVSGGVEFASDTFDAVGIAKTASIQITVEWTHTFADGGT